MFLLTPHSLTFISGCSSLSLQLNLKSSVFLFTVCMCDCVCVPVPVYAIVGRCRHICILVEIRGVNSQSFVFHLIFNCVYVWVLICACGYVHMNVVPVEIRRGHWVL